MNKGENTKFYIELIQDIISRMNSNSFSIKKWTVSIVTAVCGFSFSLESNKIIFVAIAITILMWILDGYYLSIERSYRNLYTSIITNKKEIDFDLNPQKYLYGKARWINSIFAFVSIVIYLSLILLSIGVYMSV